MKIATSYFALCLGLCLGLSSAASAGVANRATQIATGQAVYQAQCALCHDDSAHMLNDNGPALFGVVGRKVGSVEGYDYSPELGKANDRKDIWTADRLDKFLANPTHMYPGTSMPMNFDNPESRKAIIAYLKTLKP